jgi:hypothetical protein
LTPIQKQELALKLKNEENKNQRYLAEKYKISLGTVNSLLKMNTDETISLINPNKIRNVKLRKTMDLEPILFRWFQEKRSRNVTINADSLT